MSRAPELAAWRAEQQWATRLATRHGEPWTAAEDHDLVHGPGSVAQRARRLSRTYMACIRRLARLSARGGHDTTP